MWKAAIPDKVLEKLRCLFCGEYLSQLPVYLYPGQDGVACGRCPVLSEQNPTRDVCYEAIAKYLTFPCRYKPYGCLENILPDNMASHEESCTYKQYFCPFIPLASCPWQGPVNELFTHYEEHHNELALYNASFEVDLINMYEHNYLCTYLEELFIIHVKCDAREKIFRCSVKYLGSKQMARNFLFEVEFQGYNKNNTLKLPKKAVDCDAYISLNKNFAAYIETESIKKSFPDCDSVECVVNILPNDQNCIDDTNKSGIASVTTIVSHDVDEELLRELECPVCNEYMVPPIHQCVAGHSICATCKQQVMDCPTCREAIQDTRNFSLEKMTRFIKYSCKYRDYNCPFVSTSEYIRQHESECKFGPYDCPFRGYNDCHWKGQLKDIMCHAKRNHEENILEVEVITFAHENIVYEENDDDCFILKAFGEVFKLIFKFEVNDFYWSVQYVGPKEDAQNYMFELDIIDHTETNQRLFIKRHCSPLTKHNEAFDTEGSYVHLPGYLITPLRNENDLIYKCHIIKK